MTGQNSSILNDLAQGNNMSATLYIQQNFVCNIIVMGQQQSVVAFLLLCHAHVYKFHIQLFFTIPLYSDSTC